MHENGEDRFERMAKLLRVLGHPARLAMVEELRKRSWCVCELAAKLDLNNPTASKHLSQLKSVGVIGMEKDGTQVNCSLAMPCVFDMMHCADQFSLEVAEESVLKHQEETANESAATCCTIDKEHV